MTAEMRRADLRSNVPAATIEKLVKEYVPGDLRVGKDTMDMLVECCTGEAGRAPRHSAACSRPDECETVRAHHPAVAGCRVRQPGGIAVQ
jgi:hypothetical protein